MFILGIAWFDVSPLRQSTRAETEKGISQVVSGPSAREPLSLQGAVKYSVLKPSSGASLPRALKVFRIHNTQGKRESCGIV